MKIKLPKMLQCKRCGKEWRPRQEIVTICPACKSIYWNEAKKVVPVK